jgi:hypothetical protein
VFFLVYVPPDDDVVPVVALDPVDPLDDDELVLRGAVVVRRGALPDVDGAGATRAGACACSSADIESIVGLGEMESALSTGVVSVLLHATVTAASITAAAKSTFFMVFPGWRL